MTKDEYWHLGAQGEGNSGPFDTLEDARKDAVEEIENNLGYGRPPNIKIVKVVAPSFTKTTFDTTWDDQQPSDDLSHQRG